MRPIIASSNFHSIQEKWNSVDLQQRPGLCAWHLQAKCGLHPEAGSTVDPAVLAMGKSPQGDQLMDDTSELVFFSW